MDSTRRTGGHRASNESGSNVQEFSGDVSPLHASQLGTDIVFLADAFLCPLQGNFTFLDESLYPAVVIVGAPPQDFFADGLDLVNVRKKWTMFSGRVSRGRWPR